MTEQASSGPAGAPTEGDTPRRLLERDSGAGSPGLLICSEAVEGTSETVVSASKELRVQQIISSRHMIIRCTLK